MGEGDADNSRRLDRTEATEVSIIPETVSPEGLLIRAGIMRERGDESCARHLELAAEEISKVKRRKIPLTDPTIQAAGFQTATDEEAKKSRLVLLSADRRPLAVLIMDVVQTYELGAAILKDYDKLEGIK